MRNIVVVLAVLAVGAIYFWTGDDDADAPKQVSTTDNQQAALPRATPPPARYRPVVPTAPGAAYGNLQATQPGVQRFRPLEQSPGAEDNLQPLLTLPTENHSMLTNPDGRPTLEYYQPAKPAVPQYRFRPQEFSRQSRRWTGNYRQHSSLDQVGPMRPGGPQPAPESAGMWQPTIPSTTRKPMWAESLGPSYRQP